MKIVQFNVWTDKPRPIRIYKKIGAKGSAIRVKYSTELKNILNSYNKSNNKLNYKMITEFIDLFNQAISWTSLGFITKFSHSTNYDAMLEKYRLYRDLMYNFIYDESTYNNYDVYYMTSIFISGYMLNILLYIHKSNINELNVEYFLKHMLNNYRDEFLTAYMSICHTLLMFKNFILEFTESESENGNNTIKCIEYIDYLQYIKDAMKNNPFKNFPTKQEKLYKHIFNEYIFGSVSWVNNIELRELFKIDINFNKTDLDILHFIFGIMQFGGILFKNSVDKIEFLVQHELRGGKNDL